MLDRRVLRLPVLELTNHVSLCTLCTRTIYSMIVQWLVTNFGTGAAKFGQSNRSVASMDTVATLLKAYSAPAANYTRGAWYAAAALITDYFVSEATVAWYPVAFTAVVPLKNCRWTVVLHCDVL